MTKLERLEAEYESACNWYNRAFGSYASDRTQRMAETKKAKDKAWAALQKARGGEG